MERLGLGARGRPSPSLLVSFKPRFKMPIYSLPFVGFFVIL